MLTVCKTHFYALFLFCVCFLQLLCIFNLWPNANWFDLHPFLEPMPTYISERQTSHIYKVSPGMTVSKRFRMLLLKYRNTGLHLPRQTYCSFVTVACFIDLIQHHTWLLFPFPSVGGRTVSPLLIPLWSLSASLTVKHREIAECVTWSCVKSGI